MRAAAVAGPSGGLVSIAKHAKRCTPGGEPWRHAAGSRCLEHQRPLRIDGELLGLGTAQRAGRRPGGGVGHIAEFVRQAGAIGYASPRAANRRTLLPRAR